MGGSDEDILREVTRLLMEAGKAADWQEAMRLRGEAVRLVRDNLHLIRYVTVAQLAQKLKDAGYTAMEIQKIIRGVTVASEVVGSVEAGGTAAVGAAEVGSFIVIGGVGLTALEAAVCVGVCLAVVAGICGGCYVLIDIFKNGLRNPVAQATIQDYAFPYNPRRPLGRLH
jgi:hypothetical protein